MQEDKRAVAAADQQMDISHLHVVVFFGGGMGGHWHVIFKIKSNRDVRLDIINGTSRLICRHKGSLAGTRGGVLYQTNRMAEATV